jgi:hypothetical protein
MFTHAVGQQHAYGCSTEIMESPLLNACFSEDLIELSPKIVYDLEPGISEGPLSFWSEHILDIIVPCCGNEDVRIPFRLLSLVICGLGYSRLIGPKCSFFKVVFCSSSPFFLFASFSFLLNIVTLLHLPKTPGLKPRTASPPWPNRCRNTPRQGSCTPAIHADARCCKGQNNHSNHAGLHPQLRNP